MRSAITSWAWIVSKLRWWAWTKASSSSSGNSLDDARHHLAHDVLDEARVGVRLLDHVQLVGALEQRQDRRRHGALGDRGEPLGRHVLARAEQQRGLAALVVRRDRDGVEDALAILLAVAELGQALVGVIAHQPLRARAGGDAVHPHADGAARACSLAVATPISVEIS